jgi:hypothetical protein
VFEVARLQRAKLKNRARVFFVKRKSKKFLGHKTARFMTGSGTGRRASAILQSEIASASDGMIVAAGGILIAVASAPKAVLEQDMGAREGGHRKRGLDQTATAVMAKPLRPEGY